jgi:hypothetical protein
LFSILSLSGPLSGEPDRVSQMSNRASSMSIVANENNVTLFREVNCKMRLFAMKYSIEFEEKII